MNSKYDFFEIVKINENYHYKHLSGKKGAILGKAADEAGVWSYAVYIYDLDRTVHFLDDDIEKTGEFDKRETFYPEN